LSSISHFVFRNLSPYTLVVGSATHSRPSRYGFKLFYSLLPLNIPY
jgi:hypothetical protein